MTMKEMTMKNEVWKIVVFLLGLQVVVFYAHWLLYQALIFAFLPGPGMARFLWIALLVMSFTFLVSQLLVNKFSFRALDLFYTFSAVWIGTMQFLVMACIIFWFLAELLVPFGSLPPWRLIGGTLFAMALVASAYAVSKSFRPQYVRYYVNIPNLPAAWKGRKAILVSDVHIGGIRGNGSTRKMVRMINAERPDVVFMPGDLFDGTPVDYPWMAEPLRDIKAKHGAYFTEGNHEEFGDPALFVNAIRDTGVKVLNKEMDVIDGMQILGVPYESSNEPEDIRDSLAAIPFDPEKPSILLKHAPSSPRTAAEAGVSLMLCGHTHNAQMWPYSFFIRQLFGQFGYGHARCDNMDVITTSGYGTWGPPQRIGTRAEVVVIKFS